MNTQAICNSFKKEVFQGRHAFDSSFRAVDTFMGALFLASASRGSADTVYNTTGEVTGTNYTAGGVPVTWIAPALSGSVAYMTPSASLVYTTVTLSTAFDCLEIYNLTQGSRAVSVHTFGSQTITAGTFTIEMPVNNSATALLRFT